MGADFIHRFMTLVLGNARAVAMKSLSISTAKEISEYMCDMGYDASYKYDLYAQHMEYTFYNSEMIYTHSHGLTNGTGIVLMNNINLKSTNIDEGDMSGVELAYISACYAGGDFCETLYYTGNARCVVGFTSPVRASSDSNGIHEFNRLVFQYLCEGYTIRDAVDEAAGKFSDADKTTYGIDDIEILGDY